MGTHFIPNDDDSVITGVVTDVAINCEKLEDIRRCFDSQEDFNEMYDKVHRALLLQGLLKTLHSEIKNECIQNVFYYIIEYLGDKLRHKKYERMLKNEIPVYDLRRIAKLPEENQRILEHFGYSHVGIPYYKTTSFVYAIRDGERISYSDLVKEVDDSIRCVCNHDHDPSFIRDLAQFCEDLTGNGSVQTGIRFIQNEELRISDQFRGDADAPELSPGFFGDQPMLAGRQPQKLHNF